MKKIYHKRYLPKWVLNEIVEHNYMQIIQLTDEIKCQEMSPTHVGFWTTSGPDFELKMVS